eukprot:gnl/TRDRNA2_/TRDRNA2_177231_c0_seq2.p1 gnl/TRDRNA2_/TRDRNA2_177231_c0~~gnl/TRDRNA2_/TRDRNA2_177231_c0_seq2.p1  ORF type:complete len:222 (+),score=38.18 gnl/TRDRNA2_/TRDRNA2_177231_c0_seq2:71-736(+)
MASNTMYVDLDGASQSKKNSKTVRYIIGGFAAGVMLGAAVNMLNSSNSVAPEMAVGASGPIELSVGTSPFMNMIRAQHVKFPAASLVARGGAYQPGLAQPYSDNYLGKVKENSGASSGSSFSPSPSSFGGGSSPAPAPIGGGGFTPEQVAFMERQQALRGGAAPAPASSSSSSSGGFSAEQMAFMQRQQAERGGSSSSGSSAASGGYGPPQSRTIGKTYMR